MEPSPSHQTSLLKLGLGLALLIGLFAALRYFKVQELLQPVLAWVESFGAWGAIVFIMVYAVATVLLIPGSVLTVAGGTLFSLGWGFVYVFTEAMAGAILAFWVGRYLIRGWVVQQMAEKPSFQAIDRAVAQEGFKIVLLTRLSPLFPFSLLNYAFGITEVSLKDYVLGSLGIIPGTLLYVYIGTLAGNLAKVDGSPASVQTFQWLIQGGGLVATIAVTLYTAQIAKKALQEKSIE